MALTAFANETGLILLLLIAFVVALVAFKICCMSTRASNHINSTHVFSPSKEDETPMDTASSRSREKVRCLSLFKGATMLLTCIAILAVDFQVMDVTNAVPTINLRSDSGAFLDISSLLCKD